MLIIVHPLLIVTEFYNPKVINCASFSKIKSNTKETKIFKKISSFPPRESFHNFVQLTKFPLTTFLQILFDLILLMSLFRMVLSNFKTAYSNSSQDYQQYRYRLNYLAQTYFHYSLKLQLVDLCAFFRKYQIYNQILLEILQKQPNNYIIIILPIKIAFTQVSFVFYLIMLRNPLKQDQKILVNKLYQQNLKFGYSINALTDENNFYKIQINNIKKLNQTISKDLNKNASKQNTMTKSSKHIENMKSAIQADMGLMKARIPGYESTITEKNTIEPLLKVNNKIKLKNLQMKVGNQIRNTEKKKKIFEGSLSTLMKKASMAENEVNLLARQYQQIIIQNQLLENIYLADHYECLYQSIKNTQYKNLTKEIASLEEKSIEYQNKIENLRKQEKVDKKMKEQLIELINDLKQQILDLRSSNVEGIYFEEIKSQEVRQLFKLQRYQQTLQNQIKEQERKLQEQYKLNQQYKQKIFDKKDQQNKQLKVLEEEVTKYIQEVKQIKRKTNDLTKKTIPKNIKQHKI